MGPMKPMKPWEPLEPFQPKQQIKPLKPMKSMKPMKQMKPLRQMEQPETLKYVAGSPGYVLEEPLLDATSTLSPVRAQKCSLHLLNLGLACLY